MTYICISELGHQWFRYWLVACSAPSHYLNQCWFIVNWTLAKISQGNLNWNTITFVQENAFENVVCEIAAILSLIQWSLITHSFVGKLSVCWSSRWLPTNTTVSHYLNQCWFSIDQVNPSGTDATLSRAWSDRESRVYVSRQCCVMVSMVH